MNALNESDLDREGSWNSTSEIRKGFHCPSSQSKSKNGTYFKNRSPTRNAFLFCPPTRLVFFGNGDECSWRTPRDCLDQSCVKVLTLYNRAGIIIKIFVTPNDNKPSRCAYSVEDGMTPNISSSTSTVDHASVQSFRIFAHSRNVTSQGSMMRSSAYDVSNIG